MDRTIGVDGIEAAFAQVFEEYGREVDDQLREDFQAAGEFAAVEAHFSSPSESGDYRKGWDYAMEPDPYGGISVVVHNSSKPSLTHLLEKGHRNVDGGWTDAREHIEPTFEKTVDYLERRMGHG